MALFDVQSALAEILANTPATAATVATNLASVATVAGVATWQAETAKSAAVLPFAPPGPESRKSRESQPAPADDDPFRHGRSITGDPKTWTGRVVSLDEWRRLSAWDRHGPDGRLFCGICRAWVDSFPDCHGGQT